MSEPIKVPYRLRLTESQMRYLKWTAAKNGCEICDVLRTIIDKLKVGGRIVPRPGKDVDI